MMPSSRREFLGRASRTAGISALKLSLVGTIMSTCSGCGQLLRIGAGEPDTPDWPAVDEESPELIVFLVPGVIAFAVDFRDSMLYLPADGFGGTERETVRLRTISVSPENLSRDSIAHRVSEESGLDVQLDGGRYKSRPLSSIDDFLATVQQLGSE